MTADTPLPIQLDSRLPGGVGPLPSSGAVLRLKGPTQRSESTPVVRVTTRGLVARRVLDSGHTASDNVGCATGVLAVDAALVTGHRERADNRRSRSVRSGVTPQHSPSRRRTLRGVPDEQRIAEVLASEEPLECQECHWQGPQRELVRVQNDDGSVELACPRCEQAHWIFPP